MYTYDPFMVYIIGVITIKIITQLRGHKMIEITMSIVITAFLSALFCRYLDKIDGHEFLQGSDERMRF